MNGGTFLIYTGPIRQEGIRRTRDYIQEMVDSAKDEIFVLVYDLNDEDFIDRLWDASLKPVKVVVIVGRTRAANSRYGVAHRKLKKYSDDSTNKNFQVFKYRKAARHNEMHCKSIVVDGKLRSSRGYLGSANFTKGGFENNVEIGAVVTGASASSLYEFIKKIKRSRKYTEKV